MSKPYITLLQEKAAEKELELGRKLTLEEQNAIKDEALHQALVESSRAIAEQTTRS